MKYQKIIEGLKKAPYDFIANNYWQMSKEQLRDVILELIYCVDGIDERIYELDGDYRDDIVNTLLHERDWAEYIQDEQSEVIQ